MQVSTHHCAIPAPLVSELMFSVAKCCWQQVIFNNLSFFTKRAPQFYFLHNFLPYWGILLIFNYALFLSFMFLPRSTVTLNENTNCLKLWSVFRVKSSLLISLVTIGTHVWSGAGNGVDAYKSHDFEATCPQITSTGAITILLFCSWLLQCI